jgi:hypothetical protein
MEGSGSGSIPLTNGFGSEMPKNMRIRISGLRVICSHLSLSFDLGPYGQYCGSVFGSVPFGLVESGFVTETVVEVRTDFISLVSFLFVSCAVSKSKSWLILTLFRSRLDLF